ncbi:MAG: hypothetical protein QXX20_02675, partial [Candidatus Thermoplasmatota archaeon]
MQKRAWIFIGTILILAICVLLGVSHIFSPVFVIEDDLRPTTTAVFTGKTQITGTFQGFLYTDLPENPFVEKIFVFPIFGPCIIQDVNTVKVLNLKELSSASFLDALEIVKSAPTFSDVTIRSDDHPFLLGTSYGTLEINSNLQYAITAQLTLDISGIKNTFLAVLSSSNLSLRYQGEQAFLMPLYENSTLQIMADNGDILWEGTQLDSIVLLEDADFIYTQQSPLYLFPITAQTTPQTIHCLIAPADIHHIDIPHLLSETINITKTMNASSFMEKIHEFDVLIDLAPSFINGNLILIEPHHVVYIDENLHELTNIGFARTNKINVTISASNQSSIAHIHGESRLFFLDDHLYTPATENNASFYLLTFIILIWIIGLISYVLVRFYPRNIYQETLDQSLKKYSLV